MWVPGCERVLETLPFPIFCWTQQSANVLVFFENKVLVWIHLRLQHPISCLCTVQRTLFFLQKTLQEADEAQLEEIDEMLSATERVQLSKYDHSINKLHTAQLQVTETVLLLENYFKTLAYKC